MIEDESLELAITYFKEILEDSVNCGVRRANISVKKVIHRLERSRIMERLEREKVLKSLRKNSKGLNN